MLKKKIFVCFIISLLLYNFAKSQEIIIISKVDNEIITNIDIEIEKKYLLLLNNNLNKLSEKEFFNLTKNSLIREIIKKKEVKKLFNKQNEIIENKLIENFYSRLGFDKKNEFIKFLDKRKISFEDLKEKLIIENMWNQIIYGKFNNKIRINKNSIEKKIINYYNSKDKKYEYNLSEIIIEIEKDIKLKKKEISKYIEQFGFNVAANKFSKSDTSKYGGEIGWIKSTSLSKIIVNKISILKIGEITEPIQTPNGYLFLKLNNKKEIKEKLDLKKELKQQIKFEKNRQLNQFSLNYYKKLKKNTIIYENK
jgi:peptidyl-prolyl cis-trans isomerase SurA